MEGRGGQGRARQARTGPGAGRGVAACGPGRASAGRRAWRGWRGATRAATLAAALAAAAATARPTAAQGPGAAPRFPDLAPDAAVGTGVMAPCLEAVEGRVLCGRFRVHEDREAASGRTLDLAFVVLRALEGPSRTDAVTRFHGGPGAAVTALAAPLAGAVRGLRRQRDVVLVDHRGTGASGSLSCDFPFPGGVESRFGTVFPLDHVDACRSALEGRADLARYRSAWAMDDLADLTRWLGYSGLNLFGGSYGTREAQIFYRRHPDLTRTLVLNGVVPVDGPTYLHHARWLEASLEDLYAECEATEACAAAYPDLQGVVAELFRRVRADPPPVEAEGTTVPFGPGDLAYALRGLLYGASGRMPAMLRAARGGDWQPLADFYLQRQAWVGGDFAAGYHFSVLCAEDLAGLTDARVREATEGTFMGAHLVDGYRSVCARWPHARLPAEHFEPVRGDVPTLLLSGSRDPVTPAAAAERVAAGLSRHLHVVVPNGGHGQGGPCVAAMIERLMEDASVEGIDTSCVERAPPTRFVLPGGG